MILYVALIRGLDTNNEKSWSIPHRNSGVCIINELAIFGNYLPKISYRVSYVVQFINEYLLNASLQKTKLAFARQRAYTCVQ